MPVEGRKKFTKVLLVLVLCANLFVLCLDRAVAESSGVLNSILGREVDSTGSPETTKSRKRLIEVGTRSTTVIFTFSDEEYLGHGSGFFVSQSLILTNAHVVEEGVNFQVLTPGGEYLEAKVVSIGSSEDGVDLALLQIPEQVGIEPVTFARSYESLEEVFAFGFPDDALKLTVTWSSIMNDDLLAKPEVVASAGTIHLVTKETRNVEVIVHSAKIAPGSSGGPLFDACAAVVGVNTYGSVTPSEVVSTSEAYAAKDEDEVQYVLIDAGYHFAISSHEVLEFLSKRGVAISLSDGKTACADG